MRKGVIFHGRRVNDEAFQQNVFVGLVCGPGGLSNEFRACVGGDRSGWGLDG